MDEVEQAKVGNKEIIVRNILGIDKEVLELFFENKKRSGGSSIECIEIDEEEDLAIITYSDLGVVEDVLKKGPTFRIGSQPVTVELPSKLDPCTVFVEGIPEGTSLEVLEMFFENRKKSSGGDIHKIRYEEGSGVALITFQNVEVAQRVLSRENISLFNVQLRILPVTSKHLSMEARRSAASSTNAVPDPRVIYVAGIPADMNEEKLQLILESKKYSNIEIESMDLNKESGSAVITCSKKEDADKVLEKAVLQVGDAELSFSSGRTSEVHLTSQPSPASKSTHNQQGVCTIKITNLPKISEAYFKLILEEKTGANIICLTMYPEDSIAIVRFDKSKGTSDLLREKYLLLEEVKCSVIPLYTQVHDNYEGSLAIMVSGLNDAVTDEMLGMYFNNRRKSGGFDVQSVFRNPRDKKAVITFKCVNAVRSVLGMQHKQKLTLKGTELSVEMLQPLPPPPLVEEPTEPDKLIMVGAPPVSKEDIEAFLYCPNQHQNPGSKDIDIKNMLYSWTNDKILIVFSDKIDYSAMLKMCVTMPLKDKMVTLIKVSVPTMIQVRAPEPLDEEDIELYFESRKSGADGAIVNTTFLEKGCCAVIDYGNNRVVQSVLEKAHKVGGIAVKVDPFYPDFGICPYHYDPSQPWRVVPDPFEYILHDQYIGKYLMQKQSAWTLLCEVGKNNGFDVNKEKSTETQLYICYKNNNDGSPPDQVIWQKTCNQILDKLCKSILRRSFTMIAEMYETALEEVKKLTSGKDILLDFNKEKSLIIITGWIPCVRCLEDQITKCIKTLEEELTHRKSSLEEKIELERNVITIIKAKQFDKMLNYKFPTVQMQIIQGGLSLSGLPHEITTMKLFIYENIAHQIKHRPWKCSELRKRFIQKKVIYSFLISELKKAKIVVVWNIKGSEILLSAMTEQELETGQKIFEEAIVEHIIGLRKENLEVINSPSWNVLKQKLRNDLSDMVILKEDMTNQRIHLVVTRDSFNAVREEINNYFDENNMLTATVDAVKPVVELITKFHSDKIASIKNNFRRHTIHIQHNNQGFCIQSNKLILQSVVQALHHLCTGVVSKDHDLSRFGMESFFHSEKGRTVISALETMHKVICVDPKDIEPITVKYHSLSMESPSGILDTCIISGGRAVKVMHGDLVKQKVDVIVNAANDRLQHIGGLAAAIVNAGGRVIQEECSSYLQHKGEMLAGEVFASTAGHLPCKLVVHAVGPTWKGGHRGECNELYEAIYASLEKAEEASMKSVAIPAVSSGIFGFPLNKATDIICEAVKDYFMKNTSSVITEVCFIDNQINGAQSFLRSVKNCFTPGTSQLTMQDQVISGKPNTKILDQSILISVKPDTLCTKEGISITSKKGSLPDEQVDALLNSTQKDLNLSAGGLSAVLLKAAGPVIQQECHSKKPSSLNPGDIIVTSGGKLNVKSIFHGYCNHWSETSDEKELRRLISNALCEADRRNYVSLAIPAVGTGNLKYPRHIVTKVIVEEIVSFSQQHPQTTLKDVRIVLFPGDSETIQAFDNVWKSAFRQQGEARLKGRKIRNIEKMNTTTGLGNLFTREESAVLIYRIYAMDVKEIDTVTKKLDEICNSESKRHVFDKEDEQKAIAKMRGEDEQELKDLAKKHHLNISIHKNTRMKRIVIEGHSDTFVTCVSETAKMINKLQRQDMKEDMEAIISNQVQWQYQKKGCFVHYSKEINFIIEKAYLARKTSATWKEQTDSVEVLFNEMKERRKSNPTADIPVKRSVLTTSGTTAVPLPSTWSPMKIGECNCLVKLNPTDTEFQAVAQKFTPGNIQSIERVQNPELYQIYAVRKQQMDKANPGMQNELNLYHGTAASSLHNINSSGFNRSYCGKNATVYGDGVYFARDPRYSARVQYAQPDQFGNCHVYQALVLVGRSTRGSQGLKQPPYVNGSSGPRFDSVRDDSGTIFVIFHDAQAYPEYLITFK